MDARDANELKNGALSSFACDAPNPMSTVIPAARSCAAPPAASGFGSRAAITTRASPARTIAAAQGGVLP